MLNNNVNVSLFNQRSLIWYMAKTLTLPTLKSNHSCQPIYPFSSVVAQAPADVRHVASLLDTTATSHGLAELHKGGQRYPVPSGPSNVAMHTTNAMLCWPLSITAQFKVTDH